jgi:hypothetical protein
MHKGGLVILFALSTSLLSAQNVAHIQMWNEVLKNASLDRHSGDELGFSTSVHDLWAVVGAPSNDFDLNGTTSSSSSSAGYSEDAGAVYVVSRFGSYWRSPEKLVSPDRQEFDQFGYSVAIHGSTLAVGAPGEDHDGTGTSSSSTSQANYVANSGSVYLFTRVNGAWAFTAKLTAPVRASGDLFGSSLALNGTTLFVGAPQEDEDASNANPLTNAGAVYRFTLLNGTWTLNQKITASDRAAGDEFGGALDFDGTTAVVGARFADVSSVQNAGAAYTYVAGASAWSEQGKLTASDGGTNDFYGKSVSVYNQRVAIGSPGNLTKGAAYVYFLSSGTFGSEAKWTASDAQSMDQFGHALSLHGDTLAVGAFGEDHDLSGTASSTTGSGNLSNAGSVYIARINSNSLTQYQKVVSSSRTAQANFGYSVDVFQESMFVGAPYDLDASVASGTYSYFGKDVYVWTGSASSDPTNALNWKELGLPPSDHDFLFLPSANNPVFTAALYANRITVLSTCVLTVNAGNPVRADQNVYNDGQIKLLASSTNYAPLLVKGVYEGTGTVYQEQYLSQGWHQIATPMQNAWAQLQGGSSASLVPYDATAGEYGIQGSNLSDAGRGFFAQVTSGSAYGGSAFMSNSGTISVEGIPKTSSAFSIGYANNATPTNLQHTTTTVDGWNLLGNPFTCGMDFRFLSRTNVDPYFSVWDPRLNAGQGGYKFFSYVGGSLSYLVPPLQAFWVRALNASASVGSMTMIGSGSISSVSGFQKKPVGMAHLKVFSVYDTTYSDGIWVTPAETTSVEVLRVPKRFAPKTGVNIYLTPDSSAVSALVFDQGQSVVELPMRMELPSGVPGAWGLEFAVEEGAHFEWALRNVELDEVRALVSGTSVNLPSTWSATSDYVLIGTQTGLGTSTEDRHVGIRVNQRTLYVDDYSKSEGLVFLIGMDGRELNSAPLIRGTAQFEVPQSGVYVVKVQTAARTAFIHALVP